MKRKIILGVTLIIPLLFLTIVAANTSMFALDPNNNISQSNNVTFAGAAGDVLLQLPSNSSPPAPPGGTPNHPTLLHITAEHFDKTASSEAFDGMGVFIWRPVKNDFEPVAIITDSADHADFEKTVWNQTYIWYPTGPPVFPIMTNLFPNVFLAEPNDLQVWTESYGNGPSDAVVDTFRVNLTKAITIKLPYYNATGVFSNQTFTLPPFSLLFKATSSEFEDTFTFPFTGFLGASNYTFIRSGSSRFAAVRADIPDWLGGYDLEVTGHVRLHFVDTYTLPPSGVSSWFSDPFDLVWGTHDEGAMSIYASGASNTFGNTNIGTIQDGNDANAKSASYFMSSYTGTVTDIFAYVARVGAAGNGAAAIYADNGGSPGALIASTKLTNVGTAPAWVDFHLLSPVSVTVGTGYWLAISSNNGLNLNIVAGSGVRVHNGV